MKLISWTGWTKDDWTYFLKGLGSWGTFLTGIIMIAVAGV